MEWPLSDPSSFWAVCSSLHRPIKQPADPCTSQYLDAGGQIQPRRLHHQRNGSHVPPSTGRKNSASNYTEYQVTHLQVLKETRKYHLVHDQQHTSPSVLHTFTKPNYTIPIGKSCETVSMLLSCQSGNCQYLEFPEYFLRRQETFVLLLISE